MSTARSSILACFALMGVSWAAAPPKTSPQSRLFGSVSFSSCSLSTPGMTQTVEAFCGELEVPENRAAKEGRKLKLAMGWVLARRQAAARPEPIVLLAGGPGQSARDVAVVASHVLHEATREHHLLLIDQRGTGGSSPLRCPELEKEMHVDELPPEGARAALEKCLSGLEVDLTQYTTAQAVEDLEAVRVAIKAPRLNLVAVSYGTRLALEYVRRYPGSVRTMTLDGVVPPSYVLGQHAGTILDAALEGALAACAEGTICRTRLGNPLANLDWALATLRRAPVTVSSAHPRTGERSEVRLDASGLMRLVHQAAYAPLFTAALPQLLKDARDGRWDLLLAQLQLLLETQAASLSPILHYSVACAEDAPLLGKPAEDELRSRLGSELHGRYQALCKAWPPAGAQPRGSVSADTQALLLSGQFDPVTPPAGAEEVARGLPHARHLVLAGQGHNVFATGCVPKLIGRFIDSGDAETLDTSCVERIKPLPPFTSRAGWEP